MQQVLAVNLKLKLPCFATMIGGIMQQIGLLTLFTMFSCCNLPARIPFLHLPCMNWRIINFRIPLSLLSCCLYHSEEVVEAEECKEWKISFLQF